MRSQKTTVRVGFSRQPWVRRACIWLRRSWLLLLRLRLMGLARLFRGASLGGSPSKKFILSKSSVSGFGFGLGFGAIAPSWSGLYPDGVGGYISPKLSLLLYARWLSDWLLTTLGSALAPARRSSTHGRAPAALSSTTHVRLPTPPVFPRSRGAPPSASLTLHPLTSPMQLSRLWVCPSVFRVVP